MIKQWLFKNRVAVFAASLILLALGGWYIYYSFFVFHITSITPATHEFPMTSKNIQIDFNKTLDQNTNSEKNVALTGVKVEDIWFDNKTLHIMLATAPMREGQIKITLKDVSSTAGDKLNKTLTFIVVYVASKDLTEDQRNEALSESDSFASYELSQSLPIQTYYYTIRNNFPDRDGKMPIIISMNFGMDTSGSDGGPTAQDVKNFESDVRKYRTEAIKKITNLGYQTQNYKLVFAENVLIKEFGGEYIGQDYTNPTNEYEH